MQHKFSLHKIDNEKSFTFEPYEYSLFKYGDDQVAEKFGETLASAFVLEILQSYNLENIQMVGWNSGALVALYLPQMELRK